MPTTPRSKLPYPSPTDPADVPADLQKLALALDELAYAEFTADVPVTATTQPAAQTVVTAPAVTFDGLTAVWVEFQAPRVDAGPGSVTVLDLWDGSTDLGILGSVRGVVSDFVGAPVNRSRRLTPTAGAHTFSVRVWRTVSDGTVRATGTLPGHIRIFRA
jgi:hypothetical protein